MAFRTRYGEPQPYPLEEFQRTRDWMVSSGMLRPDAAFEDMVDTRAGRCSVAATLLVRTSRRRTCSRWPGDVEVRRRPEDIVFFKANSGMATHMAAAGAVIYRHGLGRDVGQQVPPQWFGTDLNPVVREGLL